MERIHLKTGDYMVRFNDGYVPPICIERKSKADLYGTLGKGMKRFKREVNRAIEEGYRFYLFIECSQSQIEKPATYQKGGRVHTVKLLPQSLLRTLNTLELKHGVIHKCFSNREEMTRAIYRLFYAAGKMYVEDKKKLQRQLKDVKAAKKLAK